MADERSPADKGRRSGDRPPASLLEAAYRFANEHGPVALIAVAAIGFMGWLWLTSLQSIAKDLATHTRDTSWYQRQTCINMATLAGSPVALCDPPREFGR